MQFDKERPQGANFKLNLNLELSGRMTKCACVCASSKIAADAAVSDTLKWYVKKTHKNFF